MIAASSSKPVFVARFVGTRGIALLVAAVVVIFGAPRLFVPKPTSAAAESAIRASWSREASARWMPQYRAARSDSARAIALAMGEAFRAGDERPITDVSIRRSIVGPPFASRWGYVIRFKTPSDSGYEYFRMSRGFGGPVSAIWWTIPLF
jgi:hypothetical protein